jgi:hypothetical protein
VAVRAIIRRSVAMLLEFFLGSYWLQILSIITPHIMVIIKHLLVLLKKMLMASIFLL